MMDIEKKEDMEPAVVPADLQPSPPSKTTSVHSGEPDHEKKYETIQTIKMNEPCATNNSNLKPMSVINSSLNLLPNQETQLPPTRKGISAITKLGIIQLVLSILLSAFGGLLIARNASLSMLGSGIWSGIFAGIAGSLGLMTIKPLLNGFLACSLISVATSTLALALTGIGLVRDYNISQQDPELESAVVAACGLTFLLILHLFTSIFSVYYSALELCSNKQVSTHQMNYEKVQQYLKSLHNAGITHSDLNGYQNYINSTKCNRQRSTQPQPPPRHIHPYSQGVYPRYHVPNYAPSHAPSHAPPSACSGYTTNARMYTLPHSYQSNFYQDFYTQDERKNQRDIRGDIERKERRKKSVADDLSYTGVDRELADSYLKSIEEKDHAHM